MFPSFLVSDIPSYKYPDLPDVIVLDHKCKEFYNQKNFNELGLRFEKLMNGETEGLESSLTAIYSLADNPSKRREWAENGTAHGDIACMYQLGLILWSESRLEQAASLIQPAAEGGFAIAQAILGSICLRRVDRLRAKAWITKAALQGLVPAQVDLGELHLDENNPRDAKYWFSKASEQGDAEATFRLAVMLHEEEDFEGAKDLYAALAELGYSAAQVNLGNIFAGQEEMESAKAWWQKAAEQGDVDACCNLTQAYALEGNGAEAQKWAERAKLCCKKEMLSQRVPNEAAPRAAANSNVCRS